MSFNYPLYSVFRTIGGFYYTYIGYNENNYNPYSFIVTHPNLSYINDHSKIWTETAIKNNILIPIMLLSDNLILQIQNCHDNIKKLNIISKSTNLPDDIEIYIKIIIGFSHRLIIKN
jgi:hypothetical protein